MWPFRKKTKQEPINNVVKPKKNWADTENLQIKMTIKSLVMFEQIVGHSYMKLKEEETVLLLYCLFICSTGYQYHFDTFSILCGNEKFINKLVEELKKTQEFFEQFKSFKREESEAGESTDKEKEDSYSITEMVDKLIFQYGVDVNYVMNDMELWELTHFFEGAQEEYHLKMEEQRLWTFLQVAPHIDVKKVKSPEKFLPFHWEKEANKERSEKQLKVEAERAKSTIGMEIKI